MSRRIAASLLSLFVLAALAGCGQKQDASLSNSASTADSLLATSPIEPPQGELQPDTSFQAQQPETRSPATSTPKPTNPARPTPKPLPTPAPEAPSVTVPAGTALSVAMDTPLTSETAQEGDSWSGTIKSPVVIGTAAPFPAGSVVRGVVAGVAPAEKGDRAFLVLRVTSIESGGRSVSIGATADSMIAGSTRKRNLGAVAGGAAAGALIGKAVGGSNKGAVIGGILGGAAATGAVVKSKGFQVTVKEGAELTFRVNSDTKIKL